MKLHTENKSPLLLASAITSAAFIGCNKKGDAISGADQVDKKTGINAPGIEETKAIAEEGFIYGLPIVMNYAVMNEFAVDTNSSQFKAPFNRNQQSGPCCDLRRHGGRHAEQRYSLFDPLVGFACGADGDFRPSSGKGPLLLGSA